MSPSAYAVALRHCKFIENLGLQAGLDPPPPAPRIGWKVLEVIKKCLKSVQLRMNLVPRRVELVKIRSKSGPNQ